MRPLRGLFNSRDYPDLLVGLGSPDDAAVWRLDEARALVVTTDFFTPVVDEPYDYGSIAAANALSDLYAMGAEPLFALNVAAMPPDLPGDLVREIMRGGAEKVLEAGAVIAGGHTIQDKEPKYGLVALGLCRPEQLLTKANAQVGDALVLTKPLGTGVTTTALKNRQASGAHVEEAVSWMTRLSAPAARLAREAGLQAATDVTGFGLLGHGLEMAEASGVRLEFCHPDIPFLSGARHYAERGQFPGGSLDNQRHFGGRVTFADTIDRDDQMLLFDAQTSGGLLLCVPETKLPGFRARATELGEPIWVIGRVKEGSGVGVVQEAYEG